MSLDFLKHPWTPLLCLLLCTPPLFAAVGEPFQDELLRSHLWKEVISMPRGERPVVGLSLSAGAVRALAHVGVIQVLDDAGFPIDVVSGTSMGAVVGSLYAGGLSLPQMWAMRDRVALDTGSNYNTVNMIRLLVSDRLLSSENMERFLTEKIGDKFFHQLDKPFACVAMDIKTGETIIFREGPVAPAVRASMNLPGIFAPLEYRHRYLVDGGVVDYIPVDAAKLLGAEWVLASVTEGDYTGILPTNVLSALNQVIDIRGAFLSREQRKQADMLVEPPVGNIRFDQPERSGEAMDKGVLTMKGRLPEAERSLILFTLPRLMRRWKNP